ncbi:hypothetical protein H8B09_19220 [Paenibacillus sp. PR3]|uniref:Uncharacterized protein n=1 Tax=Paenibacillus terricola TaxID=2763503 RepID=A0ABR8MZ96_9BACL|nr:RHS repeat-associated core domain-containing protein [Paenibacillus terricola]MBD3920905.1 hypothetical protein [Paenibacillus terricola]
MFRKTKRWYIRSLSLAMAAIIMITGVPLYPGASSDSTSILGTKKAYADTIMRVEPNQFNALSGEPATIYFTFDNPGSETSHMTKITLCTTNPEGGKPIEVSNGLIVRKSFPTGSGVENSYVWDGTVGGKTLDPGQYGICVIPDGASANNYSDIAKVEIVASPQPAAPSQLTLQPAATGDQYSVSGQADAGSTVTVEVFDANGVDQQTVKNVMASGSGKWSTKVTLPANRIVNITATAEKDGLSTGVSDVLTVMRYVKPAYDVTWEQLAGFYYKTDTIADTVAKVKDIALTNNITGAASLCAGGNQCVEKVPSGTNMLLVDPLMDGSVAQAALPQFTAARIAVRLVYDNSTQGGPVDLATGDYVYGYSGLSIDALMPIDFTISKRSRDNDAGALGVGWHHGYEWRVEEQTGGTVIVTDPNGSKSEYVPLTDRSYMSPRGETASLTKRSDGTFALTSAGQVTYAFRGDGQLASITDSNGNAITLSYSGTQLSRVATLGASLSLTYTGGRLASVTDPSGRSIGFEYDAKGDMISLKQADDTKITYTYDSSHHIASVTSPSGKEVTTIGYDDKGRVTAYSDGYGTDYGYQYEVLEEGTEPGAPSDTGGGDNSGSTTRIDPSSPKDIGNGSSVLLSGRMNNERNAPPYVQVVGLKEEIGRYLDQQLSAIDTRIAGYEGTAVRCDNCDADGMRKAVAAASGSLPVVKGNYLNLENSITLGSASKPAVVIVDGINSNKALTIDVYGTLIVKGSLNGNQALTIKAHNGGNVEQGNVWVKDSLHLNNDSIIQIDGTLRAGNLVYNNGLLTVDAKQIVIKDNLNINTKVDMNVSDNMTVGEIVSNNQLAQLDLTGDLFVRNNVAVNNNLSVKTGGYFAVGGDFTPNQKPAVQTGVGSGHTILTYATTSGSSSGGTTAKTAIVQTTVAAASTTKYVKRKQTTVTDPLGRKTTFEYDSRHRNTVYTQANGTKETFAYDANDNLVKVVDFKGKASLNRYDLHGNLLVSRDEMGFATAGRYDVKNQQVASFDALGHETAYQYDTKGNLKGITDPSGAQTTYEVNSQGNVTAVIDPMKGKTVYTYDAAGLQKTVTDATGKLQRNDRDSLNRLISQSDGIGTIVTNVYDAMDRIIESRDAKGNASTTQYDVDGNVVSSTDVSGATTVYAEDRSAHTSTVTDAQGNTFVTLADEVGNVIESTDPKGGKSKSAYNALNQLVSTTDASGRATTFTYDANGNQATITTPKGGKTTYEYNASNKLVKTTDAEGGIVQNEYDANGQLVKSVNELGYITNYRYDERGLQTQVDTLNQATRYTYDDAGRLTETTRPDGGVWKTEYDAAGRVKASVDAMGNRTVQTYDDRGRISETKDELGYVTKYEYDALDQVKTITNANHAVTVYEYDDIGQLLQVTDANGGVTKYGYDTLGRLTSVTNALNDTTRYTYDAAGNVEKRVDAEERETKYSYDATGLLLEQTNPLGQTTKRTYDPNGNVEKQTAPDGQATAYTYDKMNRVTQIKYADNAAVSYGYDKHGRRTSMKDANGTTDYRYDALDRLIRVTSPDGTAVRYEWTAGNQRSRIVYPNQKGVGYTYDLNGRMITVSDMSNTNTVYTYDKRGAILTKTLPNQATQSYTYDAVGQVTGMKQADAGGKVLEQLIYEYDPVGNREQVKRTESGKDEENPSGTAKTIITDFAYDALNQLLQANEQGGNHASYTYDKVGNRLTKVSTARPGAATVTEKYTYDAADHLTHLERGTDYQDYTYDGRGNMTKVAGVDSSSGSTRQGTLQQYKWNAANRLVEQTNEYGNKSTYRYDGDGNRLQMAVKLTNPQEEDQYPTSNPSGLTVGGWEPKYKQKNHTYNYVIDPAAALPQVLQVSDSDVPNWGETYLYGAGDEKLGMSYVPTEDPNSGWAPTLGIGNFKNISQMLYYVNDALGSPISMLTEGGQVAARYEYDEFGNPKATEKFDPNWTGPDNLVGYTGLDYDYTSGLSYARARYFDSSIGRFISEDTYLGDMRDSLTLNLYAYVKNNPLLLIDPSGHDSVCNSQESCQRVYELYQQNFIPTEMKLDGKTVQEKYLAKALGKFKKLKWSQDKIHTLWKGAQDIKDKYGIQIDPRIFLAIVIQEGTGSFNTSSSNKAADGQNGVETDFAKDVKKALNLLVGKVLGYIYYGSDFRQAVSKNQSKGGIKGLTGNVYQYINWRTPNIKLTEKKVETGVYAGMGTWHVAVKSLYNSLGSAGMSDTYESYISSISSSVVTDITKGVISSLPAYKFNPYKDSQNNLGKADGNYTIHGDN